MVLACSLRTARDRPGLRWRGFRTENDDISKSIIASLREAQHAAGSFDNIWLQLLPLVRSGSS